MDAQRKNKLKLIMTTVPNDKAEEITNLLLEEKLVACVNRIGPVKSKYFWKGEIQGDDEFILFLKTKDELLSQTLERLEEIHPYEVPEIVLLEVEDVNSSYLKWVTEVIRE
jgi:periplasmic divalent cation tolerance protein